MKWKNIHFIRYLFNTFFRVKIQIVIRNI